MKAGLCLTAVAGFFLVLSMSTSAQGTKQGKQPTNPPPPPPKKVFTPTPQPKPVVPPPMQNPKPVVIPPNTTQGKVPLPIITTPKVGTPSVDNKGKTGGTPGTFGKIAKTGTPNVGTDPNGSQVTGNTAKLKPPTTGETTKKLPTTGETTKKLPTTGETAKGTTIFPPLNSVKGAKIVSGGTAFTQKQTSSSRPKLAAAAKIPKSIATLDPQGSKNLTLLQQQMKAGNIDPNRTSLSVQNQQTLQQALASPAGQKLTGPQRLALQNFGNQNFNQTNVNVALNLLGQPGFPPSFYPALAQGIFINIGNTNPGIFPRHRHHGFFVALLGSWGAPPTIVGPDGGYIVDPGRIVDPGTTIEYPPEVLDEPEVGIASPVPQDGGEAAAPPPGAIKQSRRYVLAKNETKAKLTVYLQYETVTEKGEWKWYPSAPGGDEAVVYELQPNEEAKLLHDNWPISARRLRIWAVTADGKELTEYRDQDLWIVEEANTGERMYLAVEGETYTFAFGE